MSKSRNQRFAECFGELARACKKLRALALELEETSIVPKKKKKIPPPPPPLPTVRTYAIVFAHELPVDMLCECRWGSEYETSFYQCMLHLQLRADRFGNQWVFDKRTHQWCTVPEDRLIEVFKKLELFHEDVVEVLNQFKTLKEFTDYWGKEDKIRPGMWSYKRRKCILTAKLTFTTFVKFLISTHKKLGSLRKKH
jgi:hypothetical protein